MKYEPMELLKRMGANSQKVSLGSPMVAHCTSQKSFRMLLLQLSALETELQPLLFSELPKEALKEVHTRTQQNEKELLQSLEEFQIVQNVQTIEQAMAYRFCLLALRIRLLTNMLAPTMQTPFLFNNNDRMNLMRDLYMDQPQAKNAVLTKTFQHLAPFVLYEEHIPKPKQQQKPTITETEIVAAYVDKLFTKHYPPLHPQVAKTNTTAVINLDDDSEIEESEEGNRDRTVQRANVD